jgi:hypothetical protein
MAARTTCSVPSTAWRSSRSIPPNTGPRRVPLARRRRPPQAAIPAMPTTACQCRPRFAAVRRVWRRTRSAACWSTRRPRCAPSAAGAATTSAALAAQRTFESPEQELKSMRTRVAVALTGVLALAIMRAGAFIALATGATIITWVPIPAVPWFLGHVAVPAGHACAVHRRLELLQGLVECLAQPLDQHGSSDCAGHDRGLPVQRRGALLPVGAAGEGRRARRVLRGLGGHHRLRSARQVHGGDHQEALLRGRAQAARPEACHRPGGARRGRNGSASRERDGGRDGRRATGSAHRHRRGGAGRHLGSRRIDADW